MKKIVPGLLIVMSVVYWYVFARFVPPPPLVISRETTYFTDLKEKDGRITLAPSINALRRVSPDDNAAIEFWKMYGADILSTDSAEVAEFCGLAGIEPDLLASPALVMQLPSSASEPFVLNLSEGHHSVYRRPWQAEEFPQIAALIEANEETFALFASMAGKRGFFWPFLERYLVWQAPMNRDFRPSQPMRLLLARGMMHLRAGDLKKAWHDFACVGKAAKPLLQSGMLIYGLFGMIGMKDSADAMSLLLAQKYIDRELLQQMLVDLDELIVTRGLEKALEGEMRFHLLSMYIESEGAIWSYAALDGVPDGNDYVRFIDINVFCRKINLLADELLQACSIENVSERIAKINEFQAARAKSRPDVSVPELMTRLLWTRYLTPSAKKCSAFSELLSEIVLDITTPRYASITVEMLAYAEKFRLLKVAVLIRLHKIRTGNYPSSLDELVLEDRQTLVDSFSGRPFVFRSEGNDILVYSIGVNLQDDLGAPGETPDSGDITVTVRKF